MNRPIRPGLLILLVVLVGLLSACMTVPTPSPVEVQMTQMAAQVQACATLQALGTPYPCNPPTATSTPVPPTATPAPTNTPTATPFTGWVDYPESGGATQMPFGFQPSCEGLVGCPGHQYTYFDNGVPLNHVPGGTTGTPAYWPYVLIGVPLALVILGFLGYGMYMSMAPQRALAQAIGATVQAQSSHRLAAPSSQPALPSPTQVKIVPLVRCLAEFDKQTNIPGFREAMQAHTRKHKPSDTVSLSEVAGWITAFDRQHGANVTEQFATFAERFKFVERS